MGTLARGASLFTGQTHPLWKDPVFCIITLLGCGGRRRVWHQTKWTPCPRYTPGMAFHWNRSQTALLKVSNCTSFGLWLYDHLDFNTLNPAPEKQHPAKKNRQRGAFGSSCFIVQHFSQRSTLNASSCIVLEVFLGSVPKAEQRLPEEPNRKWEQITIASVCQKIWGRLFKAMERNSFSK